jgi:hypothetical protein
MIIAAAIAVMMIIPRIIKISGGADASASAVWRRR